MYEGYSWSGAANEPLATPSNDWITWMWQFDGQWCMSSAQERADGGSRPSSGSVAEPEKLIIVPTLQVVSAVGRVIVAVGGRDPGRMTSDVVALALRSFVTRSVTV